MAITINGSGTITGVSAGGLPDGSVTADDLASTLDLGSKTLTIPTNTTGLTTPVTGDAFFVAYSTANQWFQLTDTQVTPFNAVRYDTDGNYNTSTYKFTAPADGIYFFCFHLYSYQDDSSCEFEMIVNNSDLSGAYTNEACRWTVNRGAAAPDQYVEGNITLSLSSGDTVGTRSVGTSDFYSYRSFFYGYRVK